MNSGVKMVVGLIIFLVGIYWYAAPIIGHHGLENLFEPFINNAASTGSTFSSLVAVFAGLFGLVLIFFGLIISWIEYEDIKWEHKEKKSS